MLARNADRRTGTTIVEMAVIMSALFFVMFGLILGSIAVFYYHQVAQLAKEGARWASVHGADWAADNKQGPTTQDDVYQKVVLPRVAGMDTARLSCAVSWQDSQKVSSPYQDPVTSTLTNRSNNVTVTVTYVWNDFLFGPITLQSTSVSPMYY